jgi:hypothetical protein
MKYKSAEYFESLKARLLVYPPSILPDTMKPKRENVIREACDKPTKWDSSLDLFDLQLMALSIVRDIEVSHILGCNERVVNPLVGEYVMLRTLLEQLNKEYEGLKQFHEIKDAIVPFKTRELTSLLYDDLTQLSEEFNIDIDVASLVRKL